MLVIRVELWPDGDARRAKILGIGNIINDLTGTPEKGNYKTQFYNDSSQLVREGEIKNYPRLSKNIWDIVKLAFTKSKKVKPLLEQLREEFDMKLKEIK